MSGLLSSDDYMALLVERARENDERARRAREVRDGVLTCRADLSKVTTEGYLTVPLSRFHGAAPSHGDAVLVRDAMSRDEHAGTVVSIDKDSGHAYLDVRESAR